MTFGIIGRKVGMTQMFAPDGTRTALTVVEAGPCVVLQKKTLEKDGYTAIQVGFDPKPIQFASKAAQKEGQTVKGTRKLNSVTKPMVGHFKAAGKGAFKVVKEFRVENVDAYEVGQELGLAEFARGEFVDVVGTSKGLGMKGVLVRFNFQGGPMAHGSRFHRVPGSIGNRTSPGRVFKNTKLPGHTGDERVTSRNVRVMSMDLENNLIFLSGSVPGATSGVVLIQKRKTSSNAAR